MTAKPSTPSKPMGLKPAQFEDKGLSSSNLQTALQQTSTTSSGDKKK